MSQSLYLEEWYRREKRRQIAEMKEKREEAEKKVKKWTRKMKRRNPRDMYGEQNETATERKLNKRRSA